MKYSTLIAVVAIVKAEEGVTCGSVDDWTASTETDVTGATDDAEACGAAITTLAEADSDNDWCGHAITSTEDDTATTVCDAWTIATADGNDARAETADTPDETPSVANEAWAWTAGVAMDDFLEGEDSANMITAAVAAVATIAAVAF